MHLEKIKRKINLKQILKILLLSFEDPWPYHLLHVGFVPELEDCSSAVTQSDASGWMLKENMKAKYSICCHWNAEFLTAIICKLPG